MHLTNLNKVRVNKYNKGYVVEMQYRTWYGKNYWKHLISVAGIIDEPWYFKTYDIAIEEAAKYFRWDLHEGSAMYSNKL